MKNARPLAAPEAAFVPEVIEAPAPSGRKVRPESLSCPPVPEMPAPEVLLDRCFQELTRYYRHSCCGRLARGLVHRMNSHLQVLFFQLELLEQKDLEELQILPAAGLSAAEQLQTLQRYRAQKFRQFHQELEHLQGLAYSIVLQGAHEEAENPRQLNLNEIYRRELDLYLANPFFKHLVEKHFTFQEDLPLIYGHYLDFSQSFRNLLDNALEAMEGAPRRRLTVATSLADGRRLLHLGDTGSGISPEIMPRIFEPFFSTKGNSHPEKAGLGLFMARRLVAPYRGDLRVDSVPGETRATLVLPVN